MVQFDKEIEKVYNDKEILNYIRSKVPSYEVEDILQESIKELLEVKNKEKINNFKNYFFGIVKNRICSYYKKRVDTVELKEGVSFIEGVNDLEILIKDYPLLYEKTKGRGWKELGINEKTYYRKVKLEKERLYENLRI